MSEKTIQNWPDATTNVSAQTSKIFMLEKKIQKIIIILNFLNEFYSVAWNDTKNKQRFTFWLTRILWGFNRHGFKYNMETLKFLLIVRNVA